MAREAMQQAGVAYHTHYVAMAGFIARLMLRTLASPEAIARVVLKTMTRPHPPLRVPATLDAHLFSIMRRVMPRRLYHSFLYRNLPNIKTWGEPS
jgi:hypothetical protein